MKSLILKNLLLCLAKKNVLFTYIFQTKTDDDGKTSLEFSIEASEQKFTLHCPCHYPNYLISDDNFFVEADSDLQMWCNALNEFLLDTDGQLTLSAILDKGLSLYSSADARLVYNISRKLKKKVQDKQLVK